MWSIAFKFNEHKLRRTTFAKVMVMCECIRSNWYVFDKLTDWLSQNCSECNCNCMLFCNVSYFDSRWNFAISNSLWYVKIFTCDEVSHRTSRNWIPVFRIMISTFLQNSSLNHEIKWINVVLHMYFVFERGGSATVRKRPKYKMWNFYSYSLANICAIPYRRSTCLLYIGLNEYQANDYNNHPKIIL